jgi:hypothetical protein
MGYLDSLTILGETGGCSIGLVNETLYNPESSDNVIEYNKFYSDKPYSEYAYPTMHGVFALIDDAVVNSACVCASGGHTGIHSNCSILNNDRLLICCASKVFCLTVPNLELLWSTKADSATCFEIFKFEDSFIIHGELEISRLDPHGKALWKFSGSEIFTTPTGKEDFKINAGLVEATTWDGVKFCLDAKTGLVVKTIFP